MRICRRCGIEETIDNVLQEHHIIPKWMGGTDKDGRICLCKSCHDIIHKNMVGIIRTTTLIQLQYYKK